MDSLKKQARVAGWLYFLACITAPFSLIYVPGVLLVPGDATATASHVRAHETLLRMAIAGELLNVTLLVFAVLALYRLLRPVSQNLALAMLTLILVSIPVSLLNVLNEIAALVLVGGAAYLSVFEKSQLDALAYLFLRLHGQGLLVAEIFWGLWLFPYGLLVMRSGFIPRFIGVALLLAGFGFLASALASLFLPHEAHLVNQVAMVLEIGELPIILWLLIWGAKTQPTAVTP
jgi:hypothetical protein